MHSKLDNDVKLKTEYHKIFDEYEREGIIEEIPSYEISTGFPIFHMPHRPVVREVSTSIR